MSGGELFFLRLPDLALPHSMFEDMVVGWLSVDDVLNRFLALDSLNK